MADATDGAPAPTSNGGETAERGSNGRFVPGNPGGPGRPKGARHAALAALDAIGAAAAEDVLRRVVEDAKAGDLRAAEMLLRRLWPERRGRPVELDLPPVATAAELAHALAAVMKALAYWVLTPEEAKPVAGVLETQRRAIETSELEQRIATLEECAALPPGAGGCG